jgi:hypothetical protein
MDGDSRSGCPIAFAVTNSEDGTNSKASLQSYKNSIATRVQQEEHLELKNRIEAVQRHLQSMGRKPLGDLQSIKTESIVETLNCVEDLLDTFTAHYDFKINKQREVADLVIANRALQNKLDNSKMSSIEEINSLKEKVKQLSQEKMEKIKQNMVQKGMIESEKSILETKIRCMQNEIRKKDLTIKGLSEKLSGAHGSKFGSKLGNSTFLVDVANENSRTGKEQSNGISNSILGGLNQSFIQPEEKLQTPNLAFAALRQENEELRRIIFGLHQLVVRGIDRRRYLLLSSEGQNKENIQRIDVPEEIFRLTLRDMQDTGIKVIQKNLESLFTVIEMLDSMRDRYPRMKATIETYSNSKCSKIAQSDIDWDADKQKLMESMRSVWHDD